jgi:hypothetical protein
MNELARTSSTKTTAAGAVVFSNETASIEVVDSNNNKMKRGF